MGKHAKTHLNYLDKQTKKKSVARRNGMVLLVYRIIRTHTPSVPKDGGRRHSSPGQDEPARSNQAADGPSPTPRTRSTTVTARAREYGPLAGVKAEEKKTGSAAQENEVKRRLEVEEEEEVGVGVKTAAGIPEGVGAAVVRVAGAGGGAGAWRERRGGAEVGRAGVGRRGRGRHQLVRRRGRRAALDLARLPALRRRGRGVAAAPHALVLSPLEQQFAGSSGARGGGVGVVGGGAVAVVARGALSRRGDGCSGGRRGRRDLRRRLRLRSARLGLERRRGQERREAGAVGGDGRRRHVILARSGGRRRHRCCSRLLARAAAADAIG